MTDIFKTILVKHSAEKIYNLVSDISKYPEFLPWCENVKIYDCTKDTTDATIYIQFNGFNQFLRTKNFNQYPKTIDMFFVEGPFEELYGKWNFIHIKKNICQVEFNLNYQFSNFFVEKIFGMSFNIITSNFIEYFIKRADQIYGKNY